MIRFALLALCAAQQLFAQEAFISRCAACHGDDARGTAKGPGLAMNPRVAAQSAEQLRAYLERGNTGAGMPSFADLPAADLVTARAIPAPNQCGHDCRARDHGGARRKITWGPPQPGDWLTYNGNDSANRYSPLKQINGRECVLAEVEMGFPHCTLRPGGDAARSGRRALRHGPERGLRSRRAHRQCDLALFASGQPRVWLAMRGSAPIAELPFCATRSSSSPTTPTCWRWTAPPASCSGRLRWRRMSSQPYGGTVAPLDRQRYCRRRCRRRRSGHSRLRRRLSSPTPAPLSGGAGPCLAAASPASKPGKAKNPSQAAVPPGSRALTIRHPTRSTGPPAIRGRTATTVTVPGTIFTPTASSRSTPGPGISNGTISSRPHDLKDRDATEPNVLVDTVYKGKPSKLLLHADRNGFFYVLDRTNGQTASGQAVPAPRRLGVRASGRMAGRW